VSHGINAGGGNLDSAGHGLNIELHGISEDGIGRYAAKHDSFIVLGSVFFLTVF